jgi:hypothetical protein
MQLNPALLSPSSHLLKSLPSRSIARRGASSSGNDSSPQASAEIRAYIAARDLALAEAQRVRTDLSLNRAFLANQLVENCLQPSRSPYQAQDLSTAEAISESKRCEAAGRRIAQLRAGFAAAA